MNTVYETEASLISNRIDRDLHELAWKQLQRPIHPPQQIILPCTTLQGLYRIHHKNDLMYIGVGNLNARRTRHVSVFKNKGKPIQKKNGSSSDSPVARKMYHKDKNLDNWYFSWQTIDGEIDRDIAMFVMSRMELILGKQLKPALCTEHMLGK